MIEWYNAFAGTAIILASLALVAAQISINSELIKITKLHQEEIKEMQNKNTYRDDIRKIATELRKETPNWQYINNSGIDLAHREVLYIERLRFFKNKLTEHFITSSEYVASVLDKISVFEDFLKATEGIEFINIDEHRKTVKQTNMPIYFHNDMFTLIRYLVFELDRLKKF